MSEYTEKQIDRIENECEVVDVDERYDDMLEDTCGPVKIGMLEYNAAMVLKEVDPTAYRCGRNDYVDSCEDIVEIDAEYYNQSEVDEVLEELEDEKAA